MNRLSWLLSLPAHKNSRNGITGLEGLAMSEDFEGFDVTVAAQEDPEELGIEAFGGVSDSEEQLRTLVRVRDEVERRFSSNIHTGGLGARSGGHTSRR
jgi:hypothetical protein